MEYILIDNRETSGNYYGGRIKTVTSKGDIIFECEVTNYPNCLDSEIWVSANSIGHYYFSTCEEMQGFILLHN